MEKKQENETLGVEGGGGPGAGHIRCLSVIPVDLEALLKEMEAASLVGAE